MATHHSARTVNWLHACYGVGVTRGPVIMTRVLMANLLTLAFAYYHFVVPHRSLRQRLPHPIPTNPCSIDIIGKAHVGFRGLTHPV